MANNLQFFFLLDHIDDISRPCTVGLALLRIGHLLLSSFLSVQHFSILHLLPFLPCLLNFLLGSGRAATVLESDVPGEADEGVAERAEWTLLSRQQIYPSQAGWVDFGQLVGLIRHRLLRLDRHVWLGDVEQVSEILVLIFCQMVHVGGIYEHLGVCAFFQE